LGFGVVKNKIVEKPKFLAMKGYLLSIFKGIAEDLIELLPVLAFRDKVVEENDERTDIKKTVPCEDNRMKIFQESRAAMGARHLCR
jgi:hypothetical protein